MRVLRPLCHFQPEPCGSSAGAHCSCPYGPIARWAPVRPARPNRRPPTWAPAVESFCPRVRDDRSNAMWLSEQIRAIRERDPAARTAIEIVLTYPGLHALAVHRAAATLRRRRLFLLARVISHLGRFLTRIEIHPGATIGRRPFIDHRMGLVIGETAVIGDDCTPYQGVTLGGTGKQRGKRHPTLGDRVVVGVGAKILGAVTIGHDAKIGGGAVVLRDVPPHTTAVGVPARAVA